MAQYKVPQDVEADDKLIGPFSFRQFVYLLIAGGLIALAVLLFQLFPLLAIIPILPVFLFLALALPLKKDQPMETYLAAIVSYYLKPHNRIWVPGQKESTVIITAPKIVEKPRKREISEEEATHRLSFLADIMDTEGQSIMGANSNSSMREDLVAEANATTDMFDSYATMNLEQAIDRSQEARHEEAIQGMKEAINDEKRIEQHKDVAREMAETRAIREEINRKQAEQREETIRGMKEVIMRNEEESLNGAKLMSDHGRIGSDEPEKRPEPVMEKVIEKAKEQDLSKKADTEPPKASIIELANNPDFTVATIAKEANRINGKEEGEVFISLH